MLILQNVSHSPVQQLQSPTVASHMPSFGPKIEHKGKQEYGHHNYRETLRCYIRV